MFYDHFQITIFNSRFLFCGGGISDVLASFYRYPIRAGNKVQNVGCPAVGRHNFKLSAQKLEQKVKL